MTFKAQSRLVVFLVSLTSLILILFNIYSSRIKSGVRSYINGESAYSKGQKDALLNLSYYLNTQDISYWNRYKESLKVPMSDNLARHAMVNNEPDSIPFNHFINGKVHPSDIDNIIWMFKNFKNVKEFKEAVDLWAKSEIVLIDINRDAERFKHSTDIQLKEQLSLKIAISNAKLTELETNFSKNLSNLARKIEKLLNWVNALVTIIMIGSLSAYLMLVIAKLYKSKGELKESYDKVFDLNLELDTFVYSLSHDLRAPLTSLQGLVKFSSLETDITSIKENMLLMDRLLDKQDAFIKDVISLLQRRNLTPQPKKMNLKVVVEDAFSLNKHNADNKEIRTEIEIAKGLEEINSDIVFIKIIINNLISNAFKYSDPTKEYQFIKVKVKSDDTNLVIKVEDNGIGISEEFHQKVFDMFYILDSRKRGTGLGLYIIKQSVEKLGGTIVLDSILGVGSKFTMSLPKFS
ncbi:HAMP domain-containing histidine kinase [Pedobacter frigiditerrae]|uniref:histidine kinase n=1 Tax=Pedobacter frigiditerrae TaxID=2530452 RepID=A0A4R0MZD1_9SPHI|nr:HAMP domain-containing sensor histidine kinase [Pedobacter frigiditerrae]TCC92303.1 HAMP domain-containing histidine kinase [Pedobacter frigiditerrae]